MLKVHGMPMYSTGLKSWDKKHTHFYSFLKDDPILDDRGPGSSSS